MTAPDRRQSGEPLPRRAFISWLGAGAAGLAVTACTSSGTEPAAAAPPTSGPPAASSPTPPPAAARPSTAGAAPTNAPTAPTILVIVQLAGGNDGLNTVIPSGLGRYHDVRPDLGIAPEDALWLPGETTAAFHPALAPLEPLWTAGQLTAVHSLGMPDASRSHFAASDAWWNGSPTPGTTGWIGRWLDQSRTGTPLTGISLGRGAPILTSITEPSTSVLAVDRFSFFTPPLLNEAAVIEAWLDAARSPSTQPLIADIQRSILAAADSTDLFQSLPSADDTTVDDETFTGLLHVAADLIGADPSVRVINVGLNGFDTHATQERLHAELLGDLATGIAQFFTRAEVEGFANRVVLMTTSEFGRRVAENGSTGTDHGKGSVSFLIGPNVQRSQVIGLPDLTDLDDGDVPIEHDIRSLYREAIEWLDGTPTTADPILGQGHPSLNLLTQRA